MSTSLPNVLVVDDKPDSQRALILELKNRAKINVRHPQDIDENDLKTAHLILVDQRIENWSERDSINILSLMPRDGLSLTAIYRSWADQTKGTSPTAFAILTGHLPDLAGSLPPDSQPQVIARKHNLEWVFSKISRERLADKILSLAEAVQKLPAKWSPTNSKTNKKQVEKLLNLSDNKSWFYRAWEHIEECHPPIHELSKDSHGLAFLRWLLHRILPYPCFLWDEYYLAARFRITHKSLHDALTKDERLRNALSDYEYKGVLATFMGPRWWRPAIEQWLWDETGNDPFDLDKVRNVISKKTKRKITKLNYNEAVVCIDQKYQILPSLSNIEDAVRIYPGDWPIYADDAWTTIALAESNPSLKSLIMNRDLNNPKLRAR